ncbi:unnamed protein product [Soboliphyme baturini]|uniref:ERF1_1 domain-containing protein n=1 Tax=Soboliphyme baturini TaxID=241478 RepID=A0A183J1Q1_9BILA|nr:unnamed protein product [Soboliphyme baturini]
MKLIRKEFVKDGAGTVTMVPEEDEDMWHAYNLIQEGDLLRTSTLRKVTSESATGSTSSFRVHITLTVEVESIDYDSASGMLHVKGKNREENQYVKLGAYHTLDLEMNRKFSLTKACWDIVHLERIETCCDVAQRADVAAVVMQEGLAHIDINIPRKRKGNVTQHEKGLLKFFDAVIQAIIRHVNFDVVKCVILASPGFIREEFYNYMFQQADKEGNKALLENKPKVMKVIRNLFGLKCLVIYLEKATCTIQTVLVSIVRVSKGKG